MALIIIGLFTASIIFYFFGYDNFLLESLPLGLICGFWLPIGLGILSLKKWSWYGGLGIFGYISTVAIINLFSKISLVALSQILISLIFLYFLIKNKKLFVYTLKGSKKILLIIIFFLLTVALFFSYYLRGLGSQYQLPQNYELVIDDEKVSLEDGSYYYETRFINEKNESVVVMKLQKTEFCQQQPEEGGRIIDYQEILVNGQSGCQLGLLDQQTGKEELRSIRWNGQEHSYTLLSYDLSLSYSDLREIASQFK